MNLSDFESRTEIRNRPNRTVENFWPVGIDYGFSGIKCFSPNKTFCFPNCAVKLENEENNDFSSPSPSDITIRDASGTWIVGEKAYALLNPENAINYEDELYGRNRYFSPVFRILLKAGLGLSLLPNAICSYKGEPIAVQTGLPPKYRFQDTDAIKEALSGDYDFELKVGNADFHRYRFSILPQNVLVMDQPMGSLISSISRNDGASGGSDINVLRGNTLVFDPGFKTLDVYNISHGVSTGSGTFDNLGMYEVFNRTVRALHEKYHANVSVSSLQMALRKGTVTAFDRRTMESRLVPFDDVLFENSTTVCSEAIQKILGLYNYLQQHDYLVITGGTGAVWQSQIENYFRNMQSLTIIAANKNDTSLSNVFSNVRGYYLYLTTYLSKTR